MTRLFADAFPQNLHRASVAVKYVFDYLSHIEVIKPFVTMTILSFSVVQFVSVQFHRLLSYGFHSLRKTSTFHL